VHPAIEYLQGDLRTTHLPEDHFDLVINCSTVEHVGIAGRYGETQDDSDGDLQAMRRLRVLLAPGGKMILTVPVGRDAVFAPLCRVYGTERLPQLIDGFALLREAYWVKDEGNRWVECSKGDALQFEASAGSWDAMQNIYGLGCFLLERP